MSKLVTNLHCNSCENGIVTLTVKKVKDEVDISVKGCNGCKKSFGIKSVSQLKQVKS